MQDLQLGSPDCAPLAGRCGQVNLEDPGDPDLRVQCVRALA